ncbi:MAG: toll/interleukin-1 receptor domain-containing protein, partial [Chlorobia bacterium]|nr:toll/interleukin-1 receptor domain-containing protein [Fimbriimonadaceae bacterium]
SLDRRLREQSRVMAAELAVAPEGIGESPTQPACDAFISHASEDKDDFVRDLAKRLTDAGVTVWYDEQSLGVGDSLRRKIDEGLARSRFGIVILSTHFFKKEWPQRELDGLVALETAGRSRILPIWHKVSKDEVAAFSPTLADKVALNTAVLTIDEIVEKLVDYRDAKRR